MHDYPLDHLIVGVILTVVGLLVMIFHKSIRDWRDYWSSKDFPVGYGESWSGKYSRGGLIFAYGLIILGGAVFFIIGVLQLIRAFRG